MSALLVVFGLKAATPLVLGDLDRDGKATVLDLVRLINHINGTDLLSANLAPLADLNRDGAVNAPDVSLLRDVILGRIPQEILPFTTIASTSPDNGEANVSVTRETVVHFSRPLAVGTFLGSNRFYAAFGGQAIPARIELSSDHLTATLFYTNGLPGSARIRVHVDGNGLTDFVGSEIDADGDGAPGGIAVIDFDTVNLTPLAKTEVYGRVFASEPVRPANGNTNMSIDRPLGGVVITVDGMEDIIRGITDQMGNFRITNAPAGQFFVHIDGRPASPNFSVGAYYPFVGKLWESIAGKGVSVGDIYLPLVTAGTLQMVSATQDTTIHFSTNVLAEFPEFADVSITVPSNSLYRPDGTRGGRVGISPVPTDRMPGRPPEGLAFSIVITVQTDGGENFDRPVPVCFPNLANPLTGEPPLPPGAKSGLWSFNHDTGEFELVGPMTVSADGRLVCSDPGVGIRAPGWHGSRPGTSGPDPLAPKDECVAHFPTGPQRGQPIWPAVNETPVPEGYELVDNKDAANVYLHSGEHYQSVVDLRIKGRGFDFEWSRKYRSRVCMQTEMGVNWDYSYNIKVIPDGQSVRVCNGAAREDLYRPREADKWVHNGFFRELTTNPTNGGYVLTFHNQKSWHFLPFDGSPGAGRISQIVDRNNNTMRFQYDELGHLTNVIDTLNRNIRIGYDTNGFINSVIDFADRAVRYEHYLESDRDGSFGDLKSATTPAVTGTPNGNDFPNGKTTTYTYSRGYLDPRLNHNLVSIRDARGNVILRNTYSTNINSFDHDHVIQQSWGGSLVQLSYEQATPRPDNGNAYTKTVVIDRNGHERSYFYDVGNRLVAFQEGGIYVTHYEYNIDNQITRISYPEGNSIEYVYEADTNPTADPRVRGNLRQVVRLRGSKGGDQLSISEQYEYESGFGSSHYALGPRFVRRYTDGRNNSTRYDYDARGNRIRIVHPSGGGEEDFTYNAFGQLIQRVNPSNGSGHRRTDRFYYYETVSAGPTYLHRQVLDDYEIGIIVPNPDPNAPHFLTTTYEYDFVGNVIHRVDPRGHSTEYAVNQLDQVVRETSPEVGQGISARYRRETAYDENNNVVRVSVANIDGDGNLVGANPSWVSTFQYEELNYLTRQRQEASPGVEIVIEHDYDSGRNRVQTRFGEATAGRQPANRIRWQYDSRDLMVLETRAPGSPESSSTEFAQDGNRNVIFTRVGTESPNPHETRHTYDGYNRLAHTTDAMGNATRRTYDPNGNLTHIRVDGELEDLPGGAGNVRLSEVTSSYDPINRLTRTESEYFDPYSQQPIGDGKSIQLTDYADNSQVVRVEDDRGNAITNRYDGANRLVSVSDSKGNVITNTWDENGNITAVLEVEQSDLGRPVERFLTQNIYDNLNRLAQTTDSAGSTTRYAYDSRDNRVKRTDGKGNLTTYDYDGLNRLLKTTRVLTDNGSGTGTRVGSIVSTQQWDHSSRLVSLTDDNSHTTTYEYDPLDRRTVTRYADGTEHRSAFDVFGNEISHRDANGTVVGNGYDGLNRLTRRDVTPGAGVSAESRYEIYKYDGLSRLVYAEDDDSLVTRRHNSLSLPTREVFTAYAPTPSRPPLYSLTNRMAYDGVGNLTLLTYPSAKTLTTTYDALNRKSQISDENGLIVHYDYLGPGRVERRSFANNTRTDYTYDGVRGRPNPDGDFGVKRMVTVTHTFDDGATNRILEGRSFTWDRAGNKTSRLGVEPAGGMNLFRYDSADRLVDTTRSGGGLTPRTNAYTFDGMGNRLKVIEDTTTNAYTLDDSAPTPADAQVNQYTTTPFDSRAYDLNGNLAQTQASTNAPRGAAYNYQNQLVSMTGIEPGVQVAFGYDALGRRFHKTVTTVTTSQTNTVATRFVCLGDQVLEERDQTNGLLASYVYGRHVDEVLSMGRGAAVHYYHADDLGNVMSMSDQGGAVVERYDYEAYGEATFFDAATNQIAQSGIQNRHLFNGHRYEAEIGLYFYRARYLDPKAGRFAQRDPKGYVDGPNLFAFVGNNPWSRVDPMGTDDESEPSDKTIPHLVEFSLARGWAQAKSDLALMGNALYGAGQSAVGMAAGAASLAVGTLTGGTFGTSGLEAGLGMASSLKAVATDAIAGNWHDVGQKTVPGLQALFAKNGQGLTSAEQRALGGEIFGIGLTIAGGLQARAGLAATAAESESAFSYYIRQVETLDVSTARNGAVFHSGSGNRALAEQFAIANGRTTLEMTPGGAWLNQRQLFTTARSGLTAEQAVQVWSRLSTRFAEGASGNAVGFVNGARAGSIFNTVEYPALLNNRNVVNVITGGQ